MPSQKRHELKNEQERQQYEEDRRIFYVGMTRARDELYLFKCQDKPGEFVSETALRLPKPISDRDDVFASLQIDMLGKSYSHRELGKGRIAAQCEDRLVVCFAGHEPMYMTLSQMMGERDRRTEYMHPDAEPPKPVPESVPKVTIGTKLMHKRFGEGSVLSVKNGIAAVHFEDTHDTKHIVLSTAFKNGIITVK